MEKLSEFKFTIMQRGATNLCSVHVTTSMRERERRKKRGYINYGIKQGGILCHGGGGRTVGLRWDKCLALENASIVINFVLAVTS